MSMITWCSVTGEDEQKRPECGFFRKTMMTAEEWEANGDLRSPSIKAVRNKLAELVTTPQKKY